MYKKLASEERKALKQAAGSRRSVLIMLIGDQGTAVGSSIKGHAKRGGSKLRAEHRQDATVGITSEFRSSQTCPACFDPVMRPKATVEKDGRKVKKATNGASLCMNPKCPLYRSGLSMQNRDVQAATCIALIGASRLLLGETLAPFDRNSAACKMLNTNIEPHTSAGNGKPCPHIIYSL